MPLMLIYRRLPCIRTLLPTPPLSVTLPLIQRAARSPCDHRQQGSYAELSTGATSRLGISRQRRRQGATIHPCTLPPHTRRQAAIAGPVSSISLSIGDIPTRMHMRTAAQGDSSTRNSAVGIITSDFHRSSSRPVDKIRDQALTCGQPARPADTHPRLGGKQPPDLASADRRGTVRTLTLSTIPVFPTKWTDNYGAEYRVEGPKCAPVAWWCD
jgi:hypothetical protein